MSERQSTEPQPLNAEDLRAQLKACTKRLQHLRDDAKKRYEQRKPGSELGMCYGAEMTAYDLSLHALFVFTNGEFGEDTTPTDVTE